MTPNIIKIIKAMSNIVADIMVSFQSDFEKFDRPYMENAKQTSFPFIWIVAKSHTYLLALGEYDQFSNNDKATRFSYVIEGEPFTFYLDKKDKDDHIFLITEDEIREITAQQGKAIVKDIVTPTIVNWKANHGPLPSKHQVRMPMKFHNISLSKIKELIHDCEAHNDSSLINAFRSFHRYRRTATDQYVEIVYCPHYNEFIFCQYTNGKQGLTGGIVFHGWPESGYQKNNAVQLTPRYGWSKHT